MLIQEMERPGSRGQRGELTECTPRVALSLLLSPFTRDSRVLRQLGTLSRIGFETHILALHSPGLAEREANEEYRLHRLKCLLPPGGARGLAKVASLVECAVRMIVSGVTLRPDIIHANDLNALPIAYVISKLCGARVIYDSHELWSDPVCYQSLPAVAYRFGIWLERFLAKRCAAVITVSDGIARQMSDVLKIALPRVVRNVPAPVSFTSVDRNRLRQALGIEPGTRIILHTGSIEAGRGIDTLIEALPMLGGNTIAVLLGTVDDDAYYSAITRRAAELNVLGRILLHPAVPPADLLAYVSGADVGVSLLIDSCLNNKLALPNKLFEYLQAGLPVVVSASEERNQLLKQYGMGEGFEPGNPKALASAIHAVLEMTTHYRRNVHIAAQDLNWGREELRLVSVYRSVLPA
jgi:glycosyltransferase involved in cell wall biosynthesis